MSLVITKDEIGDPFAAMERVRKFRAQLYRPKAKYAPETPPEVDKALEHAEAVRKAEENPNRVIVRDIIDVRTGDSYKAIIKDGQEPVRATSGLAILVEVAQEYGLKVHDLKSEVRTNYIVEARRKAFYRMRVETMMSFPQAGRIMGNRDHTTALHNFLKYQELEAKGEHDRLLRLGPPKPKKARGQCRFCKAGAA